MVSFHRQLTICDSPTLQPTLFQDFLGPKLSLAPRPFSFTQLLLISTLLRPWLTRWGFTTSRELVRHLNDRLFEDSYEDNEQDGDANSQEDAGDFGVVVLLLDCRRWHFPLCRCRVRHGFVCEVRGQCAPRRCVRAASEVRTLSQGPGRTLHCRIERNTSSNLTLAYNPP